MRVNQEVETYTEAIQMKAEQGKITLMGEVKSEKDKAEIGRDHATDTGSEGDE